MFTPEPVTAGLTATRASSRYGRTSGTSACNSAPAVSAICARSDSGGRRPTTSRMAVGKRSRTPGHTCVVNHSRADWLVTTSRAPRNNTLASRESPTTPLRLMPFRSGSNAKGGTCSTLVGTGFAALGGVVRRDVRHRGHGRRSIKGSFVSSDTPRFPSHDPLARSAQSSSQTAVVIPLTVVLPQNHRQFQGGSDLLADDPRLVGEGDHSCRFRCELPNSLGELGRVGPRRNDVRVPGIRQSDRRKPASCLDHRRRADDLRICGQIKPLSGWHDQNGEPTSTVRCSDEPEMFALTSSTGRKKIRISHDNPTLRVLDRLVSIRRHAADNATPGASPSRMPLQEMKARSQRPCP